MPSIRELSSKLLDEQRRGKSRLAALLAGTKGQFTCMSMTYTSVENDESGTSSWSRSKLAGVSQICNGTMVLIVSAGGTAPLDLLVVDLLDFLCDANVRNGLDGKLFKHGFDTG